MHKYLLFTVFLSACTTTSNDKLIKKKQSKKLHIIELPSDPPATNTLSNNAKSKIRQKSNNKNQSPSPSQIVTSCQNVITYVIKPLYELKSIIISNPPSPITPLWNIANFTQEHCNNEKESKNTLNNISKAFNAHSNKVGILMPSQPNRKHLFMQILNGMQAAFEADQIAFSQTSIVKEVDGTRESILRAYAELLFHEQISMTIGGYDTYEATLLNYYAKQFFIPTLFINGSSDLTFNKYKFQIFPKQEFLASSLKKIFEKKQYKKIAIFSEKSIKTHPLVEQLKKQLEQSDIKIEKELTYNQNNFDSMEQAVKNLANIDYVARQAEYEEAFKLAEEKAKETGIPVNPKTIILPAKVEVDALIIPDDFRIVKHFIKLLKYHGVENLPLLGNQEWRSEGLLQPWEPQLEGSIFVDFIGSYADLPKELKIETSKTSPLFISPEKVVETDFKIIGHKIGKITTKILQTKVERRRDIASHIKNIPQVYNNNSPTPLFDQNNFSHWPIYYFVIHNKEIKLLSN